MPSSLPHPGGALSARDNFRPEPARKLFRAAVSAGRVPKKRMKIELAESVMNQGARRVDRQGVSAPEVRVEFDPEDPGSFRPVRLAKTDASAQLPLARFEDAELKIGAWIFLLPGDEAREEFVCTPLVVVPGVVESAVARV
jgi:hypothetical protein